MVKLQTRAASDAQVLERTARQAASGTVCAIVPTYNRAGMLAECLDSLLAQTRVPDQIIVINDGSTDNTEAVAKAYGAPVEVYSTNNKGKASALNLGLTHCRSDFVWICDDDDLATPDACRALSAALEAEPSVGFAYGRYDRFRDTPTGRKFVPMSFWPDETQQNLFLALAERLFVCQFSIMVRKDAYDEAGPFREDLIRSQDYEMILRVARRRKGVLVDGLMFHQRVHDGARGARRDRFDAKASTIKWLEYDRAFFKDLVPALRDAELTPAFARGLAGPARKRATLLQRAVLEAKRAFWDEALTHLEAACALGGDMPPSLGEMQLAFRLLGEDLPAQALFARADINRLKVLHGKNVFGRKMIEASQASIRWRTVYALQTRDFGAILFRLRLSARIIGLGRTLKVILVKSDR